MTPSSPHLLGSIWSKTIQLQFFIKPFSKDTAPFLLISSWERAIIQLHQIVSHVSSILPPYSAKYMGVSADNWGRRSCSNYYPPPTTNFNAEIIPIICIFFNCMRPCTNFCVWRSIFPEDMEWGWCGLAISSSLSLSPSLSLFLSQWNSGYCFQADGINDVPFLVATRKELYTVTWLSNNYR